MISREIFREWLLRRGDFPCKPNSDDTSNCPVEVCYYEAGVASCDELILVSRRAVSTYKDGRYMSREDSPTWLYFMVIFFDKNPQGWQVSGYEAVAELDSLELEEDCYDEE